MKKRKALEWILRDNPDEADWWSNWEKRAGDKFRRDRPSYAGLKHIAMTQGVLFDEEPEE